MLAQPDAISMKAAKKPRFARPNACRITPPILDSWGYLSNKIAVGELALAGALSPRERAFEAAAPQVVPDSLNGFPGGGIK
jgi:hypothetical protein